MPNPDDFDNQARKFDQESQNLRDQAASKDAEATKLRDDADAKSRQSMEYRQKAAQIRQEQATQDLQNAA